MQLTIGFSPCPNDTFMLDALIHHRIPGSGISWKEHVEDVETLNTWAIEGRLDVSKMSFSAWLRVQDEYALLSSGAALGHGCGPLVIAKTPISENELLQGPVGIPGELTTANLLFSLMYPQARHKIPMIFSDIESAVSNGKVIAGVIIHENRFTYAQKGLVKIQDLGEYWERETGFPIPLGAFAAKKGLGKEVITSIEAQIRDSILLAFDNPEIPMQYVRQNAQEMDDNVMRAHISTYVNDFSLNLGSQGLEAVRILQARAINAGLI
ncbi:MAG TPA: 1,4-dihydroxy-6-naphthoate synthase [Saprospiraceae bacterium]|nr:1,4-dihydroxy-6-naphthoate synthase [Saprospiraceae bacterium]